MLFNSPGGGGGGGAPVGASYVVIGLNGTLTDERVLTGTANQVIITDNGAGSTVVLSLPQNINVGASPTFANVTLTGGFVDAATGYRIAGAASANAVLRGNGTNFVSSAAAALTKTDDTNVTLTLGGTPTTCLLDATSLTLGWTGTLAVSRGGTGATALTQGSVVFAGASGVYSQDNANFFWDDTNNFLGLGTATPRISPLNIRGTITAPAGLFGEQISADTVSFANVQQKARGTVGAEAAVASGDVIMNYLARGYDGTATYSSYASNSAVIRALATDNYDSTHHGAKLEFRTVAAAATTVTTRLTIDENGLTTANHTGLLISTTTAFTNNAGASAGTLTNAPAIGNPTKWIPINDNGTTRNIPAW